MKRIALFSLVLVTTALSNLHAAPVTGSLDPYANETPAQRDARMKWWHEARFGMFIHWGVYSVPAGTYKDKRVGGIGEWIMYNGKIPVSEYRAYAKEFNPVKYNAEEWVKIAKDAGMKYIVITSKHHDGFAMFDSKASDWNIMKASPFGRDPLRELSEACQKNGIKLGFYYSQAQDWNNPGGGVCGKHWDPAQDGSMDEYIAKVAAPQVREILSNYGPIAILWWDTPCGMNKARADQLIPLLKLQPGIIHNNRLGVYSGDSETPEQEIPATGFKDRDWETCMTMNDTWGYKSYDQNWKPVDMLIRNLVDIASKGGNYLLNVGPTSEGLIPQPSVERLQQVGAWMKVNGESIYDTTASPFKKLPWGRCTKKVAPDGSTLLYLHVFAWPRDGKLVVPGLKNQPQKVYLLSDDSRKNLESGSNADGLTIAVPDSAPDKISSTVVMKIQGPLEIEQTVTAQRADGSLTLVATDAICHGKVQYEGGSNRDAIGFWINPSDYIEWQFKVTKPGKYAVTAEIASLGSGSFEIAIGNQKLKATAPTTGDYGKFQKVQLGNLELTTPGQVTLKVTPVKEGWQPMNLKSLRFKAAN